LESLGRRFMRERERRKLTLEDISASTKIRVRYLVAIEHELFDQLPGGIVSEGFIRAYARELAMDDQQAVADADYLAAVQPTPGSDPQPPPEPARGHTTRSLATRVSWEVLVAALFILAFAFVMLRYYKRGLQDRIELPAKFFAQFTEKKGQSARSRASKSPQGGINTIGTALAMLLRRYRSQRRHLVSFTSAFRRVKMLGCQSSLMASASCTIRWLQTRAKQSTAAIRTMATLAQKKGGVKDVQSILGHRKADTTVNVYMQEIEQSVKQTQDAIYRELTARPHVVKTA